MFYSWVFFRYRFFRSSSEAFWISLTFTYRKESKFNVRLLRLSWNSLICSFMCDIWFSLFFLFRTSSLNYFLTRRDYSRTSLAKSYIIFFLRSQRLKICGVLKCAKSVPLCSPALIFRICSEKERQNWSEINACYLHQNFIVIWWRCVDWRCLLSVATSFFSGRVRSSYGRVPKQVKRRMLLKL